MWSLCGRDCRAAGMMCVVPVLEWCREDTAAVRDRRLVRAVCQGCSPGSRSSVSSRALS